MVKKAKRGRPSNAVLAQRARAAQAIQHAAVPQEIPVISEREFATLVKKRTEAKRIIGEGVASLGGTIAAAVDKKNLHKGAFGIFCRLDDMSDHKRSELLFHLDLYRGMSTWDDQLDLFRASAGNITVDEDEGEGDDEDEGESAPPKAANGRTQVPPPV